MTRTGKSSRLNRAHWLLDPKAANIARDANAAIALLDAQRETNRLLGLLLVDEPVSLIPSPDWYHDPWADDEKALRYWDGAAWTHHTYYLKGMS